MTRPVEKKFVVQANTQIKDVFTKLNSVQKQTIKLFDFDGNGVLNAAEAKFFNKTVFSEKKDSIDCYNNTAKDGKQHKVTVPKEGANSGDQLILLINGMF